MTLRNKIMTAYLVWNDNLETPPTEKIKYIWHNTINNVMIPIAKFLILMSSSRAYLTRNWHTITWVFNYRLLKKTSLDLSVIIMLVISINHPIITWIVLGPIAITDHKERLIWKISSHQFMLRTVLSGRRVYLIVHSSMVWAIQVQALAWNIMLCSWARHFTLTVSLCQ